MRCTVFHPVQALRHSKLINTTFVHSPFDWVSFTGTMITGKNGNMTTKKTQASHMPPVISGDSKPAISSVFNQGGFFHAFVPILFNVIETIMCSCRFSKWGSPTTLHIQRPSDEQTLQWSCKHSFKDAKKMQNIDFLHEWWSFFHVRMSQHRNLRRIGVNIFL